MLPILETPLFMIRQEGFVAIRDRSLIQTINLLLHYLIMKTVTFLGCILFCAASLFAGCRL